MPRQRRKKGRCPKCGYSCDCTDRETRTLQGRENAKLYDREWAEYSRARLVKYPWCVRCAAKGLDRLADVTDHIVPHKGDVRKFKDPDNHQSLCIPCHNRKTRTEDM